MGDEPFGVMLGDDIVVSEKPALKQLMEVYEETGTTVVGVQPVDWSQVDKYGIIVPESMKGRLHAVRDMVEKPAAEEAPSNLAIMGRYIITPRFLKFLKRRPLAREMSCS